MVVTRRLRFDFSLERIIEQVLKKNPSPMKSGFGGFLRSEKIPSS
jgi:hypothetical protein